MQLTQKKSRRGDLLTAAAVAMLLAVMAALLYTGSLTRQVTDRKSTRLNSSHQI